MGCVGTKKQQSSPELQKNKSNKINNQWTCPNCMIFFNVGSSMTQMQQHIKVCIVQADQQVTHKQIYQQKPTRQRASSFIRQNQQFEKTPDEQGIRFSWSKVMNRSSLQKSTIKLMNTAQIKKEDFQTKQKWFRSHLESYRISWTEGCQTLQINKNNVLINSIQRLPYICLYKQVKIKFVGETANDAGGLLREWMHLVNKQILNPSLAIFQRAHTDELTYKLSFPDGKDKQFCCNILQLYGKIIGKAVFENIPLQTYLDKTLLRQLCGQQIQLKDIYSYDKQLYQSWRYLMQNKIQTDNTDLNFTIMMKDTKTGKSYDHQLITNGSNVFITQQNKSQFVKKCMQYLCYEKVKIFLKSIKTGFHSIVPQKLVNIFEPHEMEMILYGVPFIDIEDWKRNTEYEGAYYATHKTIIWFWQILSQSSQQKLGKFLHFCTGTTRTPLLGFKKLQTNRGQHSKFTIYSKPYDKNNPYPKAHTCFNRLQLPVYPSKQILRQYLEFILNANLEGVYGLD